MWIPDEIILHWDNRNREIKGKLRHIDLLTSNEVCWGQVGWRSDEYIGFTEESESRSSSIVFTIGQEVDGLEIQGWTCILWEITIEILLAGWCRVW